MPGDPTLLRVFVYGTLRPGGSHWHLVASASTDWVPATAPGLGMFVAPEGWYPYVTPVASSTVVGEVVTLADQMAIADLDEFEEHHGSGDPANLYERIVWAFLTDDGPVDAWVYVAGPAMHDPNPERIPTGDWTDRT